MSVNSPAIPGLPEELCFNILFYLDAHELGRFCTVSKNAKRMASDDRLWRSLLPGIPRQVTQVFKQFLDRHTDSYVRSEEEIAQRFQAFVEKIKPSYRENLFVCYSPLNSLFEVVVLIKEGPIPLGRQAIEMSIVPAKPNLTETYFFMGKPQKILKERTVAGGFFEPSSPFQVLVSINLNESRDININFFKKIISIMNTKSLTQQVQRPQRPRYYKAIAATAVALAAVAMSFYLGTFNSAWDR